MRQHHAFGQARRAARVGQRDEILGKHISRFYPADDIAAGKPWEELAAARRTGRSVSESWRVRKNGERFWARGVLTALYDAGGGLRGFAKVTQDLTERRQLRDLEKAARNVNEFLAMLAHELRNPLAPIRAAVEVMARTPPDAARYEELRATIARQAAQLSRIVEDMFTLTRADAGSYPVHHTLMYLDEVVDDVVRAARVLADTKQVSIELATIQSASFSGDEELVRRLVGNLLDNAVRHAPLRTTVQVHLNQRAESYVLSVSDAGEGIPRESQSHIFERFFRGDVARTSSVGGAGLGLALARWVARAHGGDVTLVHSSPQGTTFEAVLPSRS